MTGNDVVNAAMLWIGTPYKHQHSTRGQGCDCLGLIRGVWRDVKGPEPEQAPPYSPSWGEGDRDDVLLRAATEHLIPVQTKQPGDVLIFRMMANAVAKHCGFYADGHDLIHAYQGAGGVARHSLNLPWERRIVGVFRFPGVR